MFHEDSFAESEIQQRLDKWLNFACLFKTRSQATAACDDRKIKINGEVAKPAKMVKAGDVVTIKGKNGEYVNYSISALAHKNISAKDAKNLYVKQEPELTPEAKEMMVLFNKSVKKVKSKFKGRPTKKERRNMDEAKKGNISW